jgi:thiol-disulfide isomerase/thioredoxin
MRCKSHAMRPIVFVLASLACIATLQAQQPTVEGLLNDYRPTYPAVEIDVPTEDQIESCKIDVEQRDNYSAWVVFGPEGLPLRRYVDSDGDDLVDQWRYYLHGLEVYRDIDTNKNHKPDQFRWLNTAGTRWAIDANEDRKIDSWRILSAEEASRVVVDALVANDIALLQTVLISADDCEALALTEDVTSQVLESVSNPQQKVAAALQNSQVIGSGTKWMRFDCSMLVPSLIPADAGKSDTDLVVYENTLAIVETGTEASFVQLGEMIRVGDVWKLTSIPMPLSPDGLQESTVGIVFNQFTQGTFPDEVLDPAIAGFLEDLRELDAAAPGPGESAEEYARYNTSRVALLEQIAATVESPEDKETWYRQIIDGVAAGVQSNAYPNGLQKLQQIEQQLRTQTPQSDLISYVIYLRLMSDFSLRLQQASADDRNQVQQQWLESLQQYTVDYPQSEMAPEALLQLAMAHELTGQTEPAQQWYQKLIADYPQSPAAVKSQGALRRLGLEGNPLQLSGSLVSGGTLDVAQLRGKVVLVIFWATWSQPHIEDLPQLQELYRAQHGNGFEIVGVNLDTAGAPIQQFLQQNRISWPQIREEGALDSPQAQQYGIIALPTMFLVDKTGKVVTTAPSVEELKNQVPVLLQAP